jgi:hypothetical protein
MVQSMPDLEQSDTVIAGLPLVLGPAAPRPSLARSVPLAAFVSQLIANRDRLHPERSAGIDTSRGAVGAYGRGARIAERRMPLGYRKTMLV